MKEAAIKIVKEKLANRLLEFSQGPYRSRFFLVKKKDGGWRFINPLMELLYEIPVCLRLSTNFPKTLRAT